MNNPTASKQYVLPIQFTSGDITSGSFVDTGDGTVPGPFTVHYQKVGNLYFGFNVYNATLGAVNMVLGGQFVTPTTYMDDTVARICTKLGITENTRYIGNIYSGSPRTASWNTGGATWTQSNPNEQQFVIAILAN